MRKATKKKPSKALRRKALAEKLRHIRALKKRHANMKARFESQLDQIDAELDGLLGTRWIDVSESKLFRVAAYRRRIRKPMSKVK